MSAAPPLPRSASTPVTLAGTSVLRANEEGRLTDDQRRQVDLWHERAARHLLSSRPMLALIALLLMLVLFRVDLGAEVLIGNLALPVGVFLAAGLALLLPWLVRQQEWSGSDEDLEQGEVVARTGRLGWDGIGFRAHIDGEEWPTVGEHGLPLPVWLPDAATAPPAATLVGQPCTLYCLPRSGIVVLARPMAEATDLVAADRALTEVMARAFGLRESDLAAYRLGRLSPRQRRRVWLRALPSVAIGSTLVAASMAALLLALRGGAVDPLGMALLLLPGIGGAMAIRAGIRRLGAEPRVARLDAFVKPIRIRMQSEIHSRWGRFQWTVPGFLVGDHPLRVPDAAFRAMPSGTLCRLYLSPSGDLVGVDPLIDPAGEEMAAYPLVDKRPEPTGPPPRREPLTRATTMELRSEARPPEGTRDDRRRPKLITRRRRGR